MISTSVTLLLRLKQNGDAREIAWSEFDRRYAPVIAAFASRLGAEPHDVDGVVCDVISGFYAAQARFVYDPARGRLRGYLKTCVVHALAARSRKPLKIDGRPVEEVDPAAAEIEVPWSQSWERERLRRAVEQVREQLENNHTFRAFHRVAIDGEDVAAVAADLGMTPGAVYTAKSRCTARVRDAVAQIEVEEG